MRILHFVHGFPPEYTGGTEAYVARLAAAERERGHEVAIVAGSGHSRPEGVIEESAHDGLAVHRLHRPEPVPEAWFRSYSPDAEGLVGDLVRRLRPDVAHVHHWKRLTRNLVSIALRHRVPSIVTLHDLFATCPKDFRLRDGDVCDEPLPNRFCAGCVPRAGLPHATGREIDAELSLFGDALRREIALAARVLVPSAAHGDRVARLLGVDGHLLEVLPLGAIRDMKPARRGTRRAGPLRVVFFGHMDPVKGTHLVVEAVALLAKEVPLEAHLFGKPVTEEYGRLLREKAAGLPVTFHGAYRPEDLAAFEFDAAVIPSTAAESYSFVLDEAFALGLPAIVSDRGALPERAGAAGLVFRAGDAADLAGRLREIASDEPLRSRLAAAVPAEPSPKMGEHADRVLSICESIGSVVFPGRAADPEEYLRLLRQRVAVAEERRVDLIEVEARAEWLEKSKWSLESHAASLRADVAAHAKEREALLAEIGRLREEIERRNRAAAEAGNGRSSLGRRLARVFFPRA